MATLEPRIPDPTTEKPPRPRRWIPLSLRMFVLILVSLGAASITGGWLLGLWATQTIQRFWKHAQNGDVANYRKMLAEDRHDNDPKWLLEVDDLRAAAKQELIAEPVSFVDYFSGRRRFRVSWLYGSDASFDVKMGRVTVGGAFWIYMPPRPDFTRIKSQRVAEQDEDEWLPAGSSDER